MSQIALPFDWPAPEAAESFIVTDANRDAVTKLERPASWPVQAAILTGPRKSGRSLLGRIFAAKTGATLIDDGEQHRESDLFHRWNSAQEARRPLLIIALAPPPQWKIRLPDLSSRLTATPIFTIGEPDDLLARMLLEKLLGQRGLAVSIEVIAYITVRIDRTYVSIMRVVDALDSAALARRRPVTIKLARNVLIDLHMIDGQSESA
ncbi:MAG: HdaA/DnaA family protein [Sphingomonadaceae bacterium]